MAPSKKPGRSKGTKVAMCLCGRRVVGTSGERVTCPGCNAGLLISKSAKSEKRTLVFIKPSKAKKARA